MKRVIAALAACGIVFGLTACSSSEEEPMVGGMTECTLPILTETMEALYAEQEDVTLMSVDSLDCADGWAVVGAVIGDGQMGAPTSFIFQAQGQFWVPYDKAKVCGTYNPEEPDAYPSDAEVPEALYLAGCLSG
jgi:hypothetical protein